MLNLSGLFTTSGLKSYLENEVLISNNYDDYKADVFVVATQLDHSRKVIFGKYKYPSPYHDKTASYYTNIPISESVAASMSVPPFYSPSPVTNPVTKQIDYYIDGEIRETFGTTWQLITNVTLSLVVGRTPLITFKMLLALS